MADFFSKLRGQLDAGIAKVSTKSRVTIESTRLGAQIRKLTKEKEEALTRLGARVYRGMTQDGQVDQPALENDVQHISEFERSIAVLSQEIARLEALDAATPWSASEEAPPIATCDCGAPLTETMQFCGDCGKPTYEIIAKAQAAQRARAEESQTGATMVCSTCQAEISATAKFCRSCGTTVRPQQDAPSEMPSRLRCGSCGNEMIATAKFCRHCGHPIASAPPATRIQESEVGESGSEQSPKPQELTTSALYEPAKSESEEK